MKRVLFHRSKLDWEIAVLYESRMDEQEMATASSLDVSNPCSSYDSSTADYLGLQKSRIGFYACHVAQDYVISAFSASLFLQPMTVAAKDHVIDLRRSNQKRTR